MGRMTDEDVRTMRRLINAKTSEIADLVKEYLLDIYIKDGDDELLAKSTELPESYLHVVGNIPILLIAHLDTVWDDGLPYSYRYDIKTKTSVKVNKEVEDIPPYAFYDSDFEVMFGSNGLGADDRAGVFAILKILEQGYRPHVLFTYGEESGCLGAEDLMDAHPEPIDNFKFMIQLDRQGYDDSVYYDCDNIEFEEYINSFGFKTQPGSFTDIKFLSKKWKIAGVNLSVGYYDEHTPGEKWFAQDCLETIEKVCNILNDVEAAPYFPFVEKKVSSWLPATYYYSPDDGDYAEVYSNDLIEYKF